MYTDIVLMEKTEAIENFAKYLGYDKIFFEEDFKKLSIAFGSTIDKNRILIEKKIINLLINPHLDSKKDRLNERVTGLNQVLLKLAKQNHISIGLTLDQFSSRESLGRITSIIKLCRKYKVNLYVFSLAKSKYQLKSVSDIISLLKISGFTPGEAKLALTYSKS